jgi:hypothetical protein
MNYTTAKQLGERYYHGTVCPKHPEGEGHRLTSNGACVQCNTERLQALNASSDEEARKKKKKAYEMERRRRRRAEVRQERFVIALTAGQLYLAARVYAQALAQKDGNPSAWRHLWDNACDTVNFEVRKMGLPWAVLNPRDRLDPRKLRVEEDWYVVFPHKE